MPLADAAVLCEILAADGIWHQVATRVVDEVYPCDYPGLIWEYNYALLET